MTGEDGPHELHFVTDDGEVCEEIEITAEQAPLGLPKLFATHVVKKGRLRPDRGAD